MTLKNKVQLITYSDSLGGNLAELHYVLRKYLADAIGGVHILPFYPSSGDKGFAPITYDQVDAAFGTWKDIERIGNDFDLMIDFMMNHISRQSVYFQDYVLNGKASEFADMFLSFDKLSPDGKISDEDLAKIYTRKPIPPYTILERTDGSKEKVWCTFDMEQIDMDIRSPATRKFMRHNLINLARTNAKIIRLDALAYTVKKLGTNCFFIEPEVWELLEWIEDFTSAFDTEILAEVHEHYSYQLKIAQRGYWCYDFALPMLVLYTLYNHTNTAIIHWLSICPRKQITTLDTHDGIGAVDVVDLLSTEQIEQTIETLYARGSNIKRVYSGAEYQNLDIYQVNCTYFSALGNNEEAYIAARTIQFFAPGIPQVYYVGLLAGENDVELLEKMKNGRFINRHNYTIEEIQESIERKVVQRLLWLMKFRSSYPAFNGDFRINDSPENHLSLTWQFTRYHATADIDLNSYATHITYNDPQANDLVTVKI